MNRVCAKRKGTVLRVKTNQHWIKQEGLSGGPSTTWGSFFGGPSTPWGSFSEPSPKIDEFKLYILKQKAHNHRT